MAKQRPRDTGVNRTGGEGGPRQALLSRERFRRPVLYDGSKGVYLAARLAGVGLSLGDATEWLNLLSPEAVRQVHREYIDAGSQIIQTNTFNGNRLRLEVYGLGDRVREVNLAAAQVAREAAGGDVLVAGDIGPSGKLLAMGEVDERALVDAFAEQAAALVEGGVDLFHVETMSDLAEARAAVEGVRRASDRPLLLTMSFDTGRPEALRTMMGVTPAQLAQAAQEIGVFGVGANCGRGLEGYQEVVRALAGARPDAVLVVKVNAGVPRMEGGQVVYDGTPERMAGYALWCAENGVGIIGGCCGSTPRHIEAMARALVAS
jgi:5-methyltetrahydrofolate--homocysteine methyltransferase